MCGRARICYNKPPEPHNGTENLHSCFKQHHKIASASEALGNAQINFISRALFNHLINNRSAYTEINCIR